MIVLGLLLLVGAAIAREPGAVRVEGLQSEVPGTAVLHERIPRVVRQVAIVRQGVSPAMTPDGPRGPRRQCKPGPVLVSQLSGKPVVPMAYAADRVWLFPTWDRHVLPLPFSRVVK